MTPSQTDPPLRFGRELAWLILGQLGMHSAMAGLRLAAPLQALREGYSAQAVGLLMALFALAAVAWALRAGRMADRRGYHHTVRLAVGLTVAGGAAAVLATYLPGLWHFAGLCLAALLCGAGANTGMITILHTAGQLARGPTERVRVFSWLGMAPAFANVVGPVSAGFMIDAGGFRSAYLLMVILPLVGWAFARRVPAMATQARASAASAPSAWSLLNDTPGFRRLLIVNWLLSSCWDVHSFAVPILGHERHFSASTIGLVLGTFTLSVTLVRLVIPMLAHRMREITVLRVAMVGTALIFAAYPLALTPWMMALCAALLGVTLGVVQPMIMSSLHLLTPEHRHGEAIALRSMAINASSTAMPLIFGTAGAALGVSVIFWITGAAVGAGQWVARGLPLPRSSPVRPAGR